MKYGNTKWKLVVVMLAGLASGSVLADHGHFGGHFGGHSGGHFSLPMGGHFGGGHFDGRFGGHFDGGHFDGRFHHFHHHHHGDFAFFVAAPLFWGWDYPAYYSSPNVVVESSPPVYIEQDSGAAPDDQGAYWYYCPETQSYYPYVKTCPGGWQRVMPEPPP